MRKYLAILSAQEGYAERLCNVLERRDSCFLTPLGFTDVDETVCFCRSHPVAAVLADALLVDGGALTGLPGNPRLIGLTETRDAESAYGEAASGNLYRYCGVDEIVRRLAVLSGSSRIAGAGQQGGRNVKLTCVYSPSVPSLKTACALAMAAIGKRERKTLYLNLEEFSGITGLLKSTAEKTLADAVYYLKQENLDAPKLRSMICTSGSIDFIPPMPFADDVKEAGGEEWAKLIGKIGELTDYEEIIVDLPQSLYISLDIAEAGDELVVIAGGDGISGARQTDLEGFLERPEHRALNGKVRKIHLSEDLLPRAGQGGDYAEELLYGRFGEALIAELETGRGDRT